MAMQRISPRFSVIFLLSAILIVMGCGQKKILVMASGDIVIKENNVTVIPGNTHREEAIVLSEDQVKVKKGDFSADIPVPSSGLYLLNLKNDTLVGSYREVAAGEGKTKISQEELQKGIDSLQLLMEGKNISAQNRNYFIAPGTMVLVTENTSAEIIGPFRKLPTSFQGGREYEIYKFYTNSEIREIIEKLRQKQ
jgi:hypothetical protein